jgi:hypothetical protein
MNSSKNSISKPSNTTLSAVLDKVRQDIQVVAKARRNAEALQVAHESKLRREQQKISTLADQRQAKNLRHAMTGMRAIMSLAQTKEMQEFLKLDSELERSGVAHVSDGRGEFCLYQGMYNVDEDVANFASATILLKPDAVWLVGNTYHDFPHQETRLVFPCHVKDAKLAKQLISSSGAVEWTTEQPIIGSETLKYAMKPCQDDFPGTIEISQIFGRVLIDCADPKVFEKYCEKAFALLLR